MEYVLWGNPPGHDTTYGKALLVTGLTSADQAARVQRQLESEHGVTDITTQVIGGALPDFASAVAI